METYMIMRKYASGNEKTLDTGLTLDEVRAHCKDPETSSRTASTAEAIEHTEQNGPWFDVYEQE